VILVAGIDEAGRGPVIGPMVLAAVAIEQDRIPELVEAGAADSKKLSPKRREAVAAALRAIPGIRIEIEVVTPAEIDAAVRNRAFSLNGLEISRMASLIERIEPDEVYVDMVGHSGAKMALSLHRLIECRPRIVAAAKADATYAVTSAASVIAKTRRDAEIRLLEERYESHFGPLGSGYPSDPKTVEFLKRAVTTDATFIRRSWGSVERLQESPVGDVGSMRAIEVNA
jgi:ribonuclease HII